MTEIRKGFVFILLALAVVAALVAPIMVFALDASLGPNTASYTMTVSTDQSTYPASAVVTISGTLMNSSSPVSSVPVSVQVTKPSGEPLFVDQFMTDDSGRFIVAFMLPDSAEQGTYPVVVAYESANARTAFAVVPATPEFSSTYPIVVAVSMIIALGLISRRKP